MKRIKGYIRAAYIYGILPEIQQSRMLNYFSSEELRKLNSGLSKISALSLGDKKMILAGFLKTIRYSIASKKRVIEQSAVASLTVLALVLLTSFIYARSQHYIIDDTIDLMESVLSKGGIHLAIFPLLYGIILNESGLSPLRILLKSSSYYLDTVISLAAAAIIFVLFVMGLESGENSSPLSAQVFSIAVSVTVVPAAEELFFRYYIFFRSGKKTGYAASATVSSLIFSAVHLPDSLPAFAVYCIAGALLCGIYHVRKSLYPAFCTHALSNLFLLLL